MKGRWRVDNWIKNICVTNSLQINFNRGNNMVVDLVMLPNFNHKHTADRIIAATAAYLNDLLVTSEKNSRNYKYIKKLGSNVKLQSR